VTSKPTTEASGASSPVTNIGDDCEDTGGADELDPPLQLAPSIESASKIAIATILFMAHSDSKGL
jgi:hypothetical protein